MPYIYVPPCQPVWVDINCNGIKLEVCRVTLKDIDFDECIKIAPALDSKNWDETSYRRGLLNNKTDETFDTEEIGVLSEYAICKLLGIVLDANKKDGGCDFDFEINNKRFDVKGSKCFRGKNYIKAVHENGYKCNLKSDFYFLCYINHELTNRKEKTVVIDIVGLISRESVEKISLSASPTKSKHKNFEVCYDNPDIKNIREVYKAFKSKGQEQYIEGNKLIL